MKKTSIFNLGGNACYIDEDAAEVLKTISTASVNISGKVPRPTK